MIRFFKYFSITFLVYEIFMLIDFISRYNDDIFGKGFPISPIIKFIGYCSTSILGFSFLGAFIMATILYYRHSTLHNETRFLIRLRKGFLWAIFLGIVLFFYNAWILPVSNLEMRVLLYNFQSTAPDSALKTPDKDLFSESFSTMNINHLNYYIDSVETNIKSDKIKFDSIINIIPDTTSAKLKAKIDNPTMYVGNLINHEDSIPEELIRLIIKGESIAYSFKDRQAKLSKYKDEMFKRLIIPIEILLYFIVCASLGFYYHDQKKFLLVIAGLFSTSFFYWNISTFDRVGVVDTSNFLTWLILHTIILIGVVIVFFSLALKKEKNYTT